MQTLKTDCSSNGSLPAAVILSLIHLQCFTESDTQCHKYFGSNIT